MPFDANEILGANGPLAEMLPGYESRPQQQRMAQAVQRTLAEQGRLLVEAGTGVGKTFAYLLPAIERIIEHDERVIVSTHTISLQEQILRQDVPLLTELMKRRLGDSASPPFRAVLVKGRGNYISIRRLQLATTRQARLFVDAASQRSLRAVQQWAYATTDGSLATLPQLERRSIWDRVQSDSGNCMGRKCPTYNKCFFQAARREMERADLLICNHALFFSELALRLEGASFLPPFDHVILDEAHQVEEVAGDHFGRSLSEGRVRHLLSSLHHERTGRGFLAELKLTGGESDPVAGLIKQVLDAGEAARAFFESLNKYRNFEGPRNGRITERDIVENVLSPAMRELSAVLKDARKRTRSDEDAYELAAYAERAGSIAKDAQVLLGQQIDDCVYWLSATGGGPRQRLELACSPIDVGPILRERLFGLEVGVVLTSATLTTGAASDDDETASQPFQHTAQRLGCVDADTLMLGSPFDHSEQVELYIDETMPEPTARGYVEELVPRVLEHIRATDGGAFVLFTSYATMNRAAELLRPNLAADGHPMYMQGEDGSRTVILDLFRKDRRAVLLGAASFWQGVDVRGEGLRNVIITRLPFDPPDRPLTEARAERIQAQGGNAFMQDQLPRAVIRFKQGFGRLIRSAADTGRVVVLDPRIVKKRYGQYFLRALPEGVRVRRSGSESAMSHDEWAAER